MSLGGELLTGNSNLVDEPLGVVQIGFAGYDLGKTTEETTLSPDTDYKDINYQQDGTKKADVVITGEMYVLKAVFGEINTSLLKLLKYGLASTNASAANDNMDINRSLYKSMRENFADVLKVASVGPNGIPSDLDTDNLFFYEVVPVIDGQLINWGADTQRNVTVNFQIFWHRFSTGESVAKDGSFGYWGDPTELDIPDADWPDVEAPILVSAEATAATTMVVTFNENIAFLGGGAFAATMFAADVDGVLVLPTAGVIASAAVTLTFPAATFSVGDIIKLTITGAAIEDTEATANVFAGIAGFLCTNSV